MSQQETEAIVAVFEGQDRARTIYPELKPQLGSGSMTVSMNEMGQVRMQGSMVVMAATMGGALLGIIVGAIIGLIANGFIGLIIGAIIGGIIGGLLFRWLTPKATRDSGATINLDDTSSRTGEYNQALAELLSPGKSAVLAIVEPYRADMVVDALRGYDPERIARGIGNDFTDVMHNAAESAPVADAEESVDASTETGGQADESPAT